MLSTWLTIPGGSERRWLVSRGVGGRGEGGGGAPKT
jgi:hypothetical protein